MLVPFTEADYVMDMGHFDMMTDGDVAFRKEVVELFLQILDESTPVLASDRLDFSEWNKEAHKLKGAALNIGARRLGMVCLAMEHCQKPNERPELIQIYAREMEALRHTLGNLATL